jgi:hypothetical protein
MVFNNINETPLIRSLREAIEDKGSNDPLLTPNMVLQDIKRNLLLAHTVEHNVDFNEEDFDKAMIWIDTIQGLEYWRGLQRFYYWY